MSTPNSLTVEFIRGGYVEAAHPIAAVLVDGRGAVLERIGAPALTTWRSSAKPFQLVESLKHLPTEVVAALSSEQLAVGAASHSGEPFHTAIVQQLLGQFALSSDALFCGIHPPMHKPSELALAREGLSPSVLDSNCSGKHTFMAAASRHAGWEADYRPANHPLQVAIRQSVQAFTDGAVKDAVTDGCGVPCFVLELHGMAHAYAALGTAHQQDPTSVLGRIARAMASAPEYISGSDRSDLAFVRGTSDPVISKVGAEGLLCVAFPERNMALALKVLSGHEDARMPALRALCERWFSGVINESIWNQFCTLRSVAGAVVGQRAARWS